MSSPYMGCGSSLGGLEATFLFCFLRLRRRKKASVASSMRATGTPTAGPIMAPRFVELPPSGGDECVGEAF